MKYPLIILSLMFCSAAMMAQQEQERLKGEVSYITSQNVYVRFQSTQGISVGDTLFLMSDKEFLPALKVENLSSLSCVCTPLSDMEFTDSMNVYTKEAGKPETTEEPPELPPEEIEQDTAVPVYDTAGARTGEKRPEQQVSGRFAISSYTNFSNTEAANTQKMRYTASFNIRNIAGTRLSAESYISFVHDNRTWDEIKENVFNGLKIYSLALRYDVSPGTSFLLGRKINPRLSSMGAIDGLQFEKKFRSFSVGAVLGSRPDYRDYSYDFNLFQGGAYVSHDFSKESRYMQNTLAIIQQMNAWSIDRRFIYFQHINSLVDNLFLIGTAELDLYEKISGEASGTLRLSNLYLSLRYRVIRQLSFTVSYNARQNIIYYETYKNIVEELIEDEMLQGFRFRVHSTPFRNFSLGATFGYRYRKDDPRPSRNVYAYTSYSNVPLINATATASYTWLESGYLSGSIYSAGLSKDLIPGKLSGGLNYRYVDYSFTHDVSALAQNLAELNLMWRILRKLSLSVYYEGTFENIHSYNRIYINLTQRL